MSRFRVHVYKASNTEPLFESNPNSITPFFDALDKYRRYLRLLSPMAVLGDIAKIADDPYIQCSRKMMAAVQLLQIVFKNAEYDLKVSGWVEQ